MERVAATVLLVAAAAPFWSGRFLPFLDMPQHLGLAAVVTHYRDPATAFARTYAVDPVVTPYWGYYGAMWILGSGGRGLPLELANRLLFTGYAIGIPLAAAYLLASFGRDRRWAVLTIPLVFNTNLFLGFATFLLSMPLFLMALGLSERHLAEERTRARHVLLLALLSTLVFLCHVQTYLLLGLCVLILLLVHALAHARGLGWLAARGAAYLPSLALFACWSWRSFVRPDRASMAPHTVHHDAFGTPGELGAIYEPWRVVLTTMPERLMGAFTDGSDGRIALALLAVFAVALLVSHGPVPVRVADGAASNGAGPGATSLRRRARWMLAHRCDLLLLALIASYLFLPMQISGQWYLNARYLVFGALGLPLLLAGPVRGRRTALLGAAGVLALLACANTAAKIHAFQRQVGPFDAIVGALPPRGRVLGLPFDNGSGGPLRLWPFLHWAGYHQVFAGGDVGFSFAGLPSIPVRYRSGMQAPHPYEWRPDQFDWASMGRYYDAFLVSGVPRGRGGEELRRNATVVARAGPWTIWKARPSP
jgi:hypothetical protein